MTLRVRDSKSACRRSSYIAKSVKCLKADQEKRSSRAKALTRLTELSEPNPATSGRYVCSFTGTSDVTFVTTLRSRFSTSQKQDTEDCSFETQQEPIDLTQSSSVRHCSSVASENFRESLRDQEARLGSWLLGDETSVSLLESNDKDLNSSTRSTKKKIVLQPFESVEESRKASTNCSFEMLSSRRHHSDETFGDREHLTDVAGKSSYPHSAEAWLDYRGSPRGEIANEVANENSRDSSRSNCNSTCSNDVEKTEMRACTSGGGSERDGEEQQDIPFNYSLRNREPNPECIENNVESSLMKAKRARVETIVTSIKVKPTRVPAGSPGPNFSPHPNNDVSPRKRRMGEKIRELQKKIETLQKECRSEDVCDVTTECYDVEDDGLDHDWDPDEKRPRIDDDFESTYGATAQRNSNGYYRGSINLMVPQNGRRRLDANELVTPNFAYQVLVQSIKRELTLALEKVAEKSAKRVLEELRSGKGKPTPDVDGESWNGKIDKPDPPGDNLDRIAKNINEDEVTDLIAQKKFYVNSARYLDDDKTQRVHTSNQSQMCFGDMQVRKNRAESKERGENHSPKLSSSNFSYERKKREDWDRDSSPIPSRTHSPEHLSSSENNEVQTQALSLVKKKHLSSSPEEEKSSSPPHSFVSRDQGPSGATTPEQDHDNVGRFPRPSLSSEPSLRSDRSSSDPSSKSKFVHPACLPDSGFFPTNTSAFRLPFRSDALPSPSFRRDSFPSSNLLKSSPFSFGPSMYPSSTGHSPSVFPFTSGQLPFPIFQNFQQRNLANVIADYGRFTDGFGISNGRPISTRTSTKDLPRVSGLSRTHHKGDGMDFTGAVKEVSRFSATSIHEALTPQHLKKAKLMFFYTRYPSANTLKTFFADIKFSRATTSQLIKWFSNFREFYYIQMEKFARQALSDGVVDSKHLQVTRECELFRVLNLHYNKSNDFRVPNDFVVATLRSLQEFFVAIQKGKDRDPSWKKVIYKIICKLDQDIPDIFKFPNVLERLDEIAN